MGATLAELRARVQGNYAETGTAFTDAPEINQWLQEAHDKLAETGYLIAECTLNLVDGQENYDISGATGTNAYRIYELLDVMYLKDGAGDTDPWHRLRPKPYWEIRQYYNGTELKGGGFSSESEPAWYCWQAQYLYLLPVPSYDEDDALKLTFKAMELIDDDADETHLPRQGEDAAVDYALAQWYAKDRRQDLHQYHMHRFELTKGQMSGWYQSNRSNEPQMLAPSERRRMAFR